jgi:hypothetical protein
MAASSRRKLAPAVNPILGAAVASEEKEWRGHQDDEMNDEAGS